VLEHGTRGRGYLPRVLEHGTRGRCFPIFLQTSPSNCAVKCKFPFASAPLPRVLHSRKMAFPECLPSPRVMRFPALGKDWLPRVPDFWHSGKNLALGEFHFSRSVCCIYSRSITLLTQLHLWLHALEHHMNCILPCQPSHGSSMHSFPRKVKSHQLHASPLYPNSR
jgi:hypothetical protein